jgi:integrase
VERSTGPLVLGPPKSRAGRHIVGIPAAIVPDPERHLAVYVKPEPGALVFPGIMGGPVRRGNFNKLAAWPHAVEALGMPGLHVHDLRHTGNQFATNSGAGLRDLMARMGHDSERAAMIYQHEARVADNGHHRRDRQARRRRAPPGRRRGRRPSRGARARLMARRPVRP